MCVRVFVRLFCATEREGVRASGEWESQSKNQEISERK